MATHGAALAMGIMAGIVTKRSFHCEEQDEFKKERAYYAFPSSTSSIKVFSGNANPILANEVAMHLGTQLGRITVKPYADGETAVKVHDSVRGRDVYIIQPTCQPVNNNLMELLLMITTMRRASAKKITAVIPYFGYSRSTETFAESRPIAGADVAIMLEVAGVDRVVAIDLHRGQMQGFFSPNIPVDNLDVSKIALPYLQTKFLRNPVVVSPDANGTARAKLFSDRMMKYGFQSTFAMIVDSKCGTDDEQLYSGGKKVKKQREYQLVGDVRGRDVIIVDDIIDSAGRMTRTAQLVRENGAARIFAFASHGLFTGNAIERLEKSSIMEVLVLNTVPTPNAQHSSKIQHLSVAAMLAETIRRIHSKHAISDILS